MVWRYTQNVKAMEKARVRLNREAIRLVSKKDGAYIKHPQFEPKPVQLFHADGVHLSQLGKDLLLNNFLGLIDKILVGGGVTYTCN